MLKFYNNEFFFFNKFNKFKNIIKFIKPLKSYVTIITLKNIFNFGIISKKNTNMVLSLPINRQRTRSRKPKYYNIKNQIMLYLFLLKYFKLSKIKLSRNFLIFDYINRLWFKQWSDEWWLIRRKRLFVKKITYRGRINVNFPILKYKHIIRNLKTVNKKKTKFLKHFNLGFFFYEYVIEAKTINRFNKRVLKRKFSKYFIYRTIKKN